jgi:hypothetical protein
VVAGLQPATWADEGLPDRGSNRSKKENFGLAPAAQATAGQARGKDTASIQDEQVAGAEELREVSKKMVARRARPPIESE